MLINLYIVSKLCWDILAKQQINVDNTKPVYKDLLDLIYDLYPHLDPDKDFKLFWQYSAQDFLPINDFVSYSTSLKLMATDAIYMLLNDLLNDHVDTRLLIKKLDMEEIIMAKMKAKTKYDVTIWPTKGVSCRCSTINVSEEYDDDVVISDKEIIIHALRNEPVREYWTADKIFKHQVIENIKKGWPKERNKVNKQFYDGECLETKLKKQSPERR